VDTTLANLNSQYNTALYNNINHNDNNSKHNDNDDNDDDDDDESSGSRRLESVSIKLIVECCEVVLAYARAQIIDQVIRLK